MRILGPADAAIYRELRLLSLQQSPLAFSDSYEDEKERDFSLYEQDLVSEGNPPDVYILGAFWEEKLVGFVKFKRDRRRNALHKSMLHIMFVDERYRGKGIGRAIVQAVIDRAKAMDGLQQIHLWVLESPNVSAADFYATFGLVRTGPAVKQDLIINGQFVDAAYMVLYLK